MVLGKCEAETAKEHSDDVQVQTSFDWRVAPVKDGANPFARRHSVGLQSIAESLLETCMKITRFEITTQKQKP
jgi:hypothetical protein